jgi:hypothetical protein
MSIGIIGTGISGLQLALFLQHFGVDTVVYADKTPDDLRTARLPNTVGRFEHTRAREQAVGVDHWNFDDDGWAMYSVHLWVNGEPPLYFRGDPSRPASFVDFRIYLPRLLEDYAGRGGRVEFVRPEPHDVTRIAARHDLVVVATGAKALTGLFPVAPEHSPYDRPQRLLMAGLFRGISQTDPPGLTYVVAPGLGEIFQAPFYSFEGRGANLLFEAVPGGPFEPVTRMRYEDDPAAFESTVLALLREHVPALYERIEPLEFALTRPLDLLQGAITPVVRRASVSLDGGAYAMAVGDSWILNDPLLGQGANLGSHCAEVMAQAIRGATCFDEGFCRATEARMWEFAGPVTAWTNAMLQPPPAHAIGLLVAAAQSKAVADALVDGFNRPPEQWNRFSSPEGAAAFLAEFGLALPELVSPGKGPPT